MDVPLLFRGCERLLIVSGAIAAVVFGALLLKWGIFTPSNFSLSGNASEKVGKFKIEFGNAAPGSLFALFGAIILCVCLFSPFTGEEKTSSQASAPSNAPAPARDSAGQTTTSPPATTRADVGTAKAPTNQTTYKSWRYSDPQKFAEFLDHINALKQVDQDELTYLQKTATALKAQYEQKESASPSTEKPK